ncbi:MAG: hypothetical protein Tsb0020_26980 [Haliangiales bacterium]
MNQPNLVQPSAPWLWATLAAALLLAGPGCRSAQQGDAPPKGADSDPKASGAHGNEPALAFGLGKDFPGPAEDVPLRAGEPAKAVFAGGCFWCVEAVFEQIDGVSEVISGYAGGSAETASYRDVLTGDTDHAEVVQVVYDPGKVTYGTLLRVFFVTHDPTQLNRQGPDVGRQYRSAIFYGSEDERRVAEAYIRQIEAAELFEQPVVTTLEPLAGFYPAEAHHQDYARRNPDQPYIRYQAQPKLKKLQEQLPELLAPNRGDAAAPEPTGAEPE